MKKSFFLFFILVSSVFLGAEVNFSLSGYNDAEYIYKDVEGDTLKHFFTDELTLTLQYEKLRFGLKFVGDYPDYDKYNPAAELSSKEVTYEWKERYLEADLDHLWLRAGNFDAVIGRGLVLHAYRDKDFDTDTRIEGLIAKSYGKGWEIKALYGAVEAKDNENKNDVVGAVDVDYIPASFLRVGASVLQHNEYKSTIAGKDNYLDRYIYAGRATLTHALGNLYAEYASAQKEHQPADNGRAFYADMSIYCQSITFSSAYKNYRHFDSRLNDLPLANYSGEPLNDALATGYDEEGYMGEIQYAEVHEIIVNYAESWSHDFRYRQQDYHLENTLNLSGLKIISEVNYLEQNNKDAEKWKSELKPAVSFQFAAYENPATVKIQCKYTKNEISNDEFSYYEPYLQLDYGIKRINVSLIGEYRFTDSDDIFEISPWIGGELTASVYENTELTLFAGKEKGGKVCRNGSCKYQPSFEGLRLNLITRF